MACFACRLALVCAVLASSAYGQRTAIEPALLAPSDSRTVEVLPFRFESHPQCDKAGNMYFHLWTSNGDLAAIARLSPDAKEKMLLALPGEFAHGGLVTFTDFSVTPAGQMQMLAGVEAQLYVFHFGSDGKFEKAIPVKVPKEGVLISNIVAFDNGATLLLGNYNAGAPAELKGKSYLATLDPAGKQTRLAQPQLPNVDLSAENLATGAASGEDGNAYFLSGDSVWVLSQTGELVRQIRLQKPDPKDVLVNVRVSANWLVVDLATRTPDPAHPNASRDQQPITFRFLLVEVTSGDAIGLYELPPTLRGIDEVCFSRQQGLTFMTQQNGKLAFFGATF